MKRTIQVTICDFDDLNEAAKDYVIYSQIRDDVASPSEWFFNRYPELDMNGVAEDLVEEIYDRYVDRVIDFITQSNRKYFEDGRVIRK
jgi:hypothetical protein